MSRGINLGARYEGSEILIARKFEKFCLRTAPRNWRNSMKVSSSLYGDEQKNMRPGRKCLFRGADGLRVVGEIVGDFLAGFVWEGVAFTK